MSAQQSRITGKNLINNLMQRKQNFGSELQHAELRQIIADEIQ